ncbi:MAG: glycosyltransferase family 2 protein [Lacipirellulaceae bacterium]
MTTTVLAALSLVFAALPFYFYLRNRVVFRLAPFEAPSADTRLSVLVPARNEAANIEACVESILAAADGVTVEVVALDDSSEDDTAAIVALLTSGDSRVRSLRGAPLPAGWNGKQHACQQLAEAARYERLLFLDADVRLEPHAIPRLVAEQRRSGAALVSGFPRQVTGTLSEGLLLPLIHFILLGFLSLRRMRQDADPAFGAGCGQLFFTEKDAYFAAGGHAAVKSSRHDGVTLPRAYRKAGLATDLFDATDLARCRMYAGARQVWRGLLKNATEGVAKPALLPAVTLVLGLGQVAPLPILVASCWGGGWSAASVLAGLAAIASYAPRFDAADRFRQSRLGALLHPLGVLLFLVAQWEALVRSTTGKQVAWKGRQ